MPRATALFLLLSLLPAGAAAQETIRWLEMDFPPFFISEGPAAGEGIGDRITGVLIDSLPGYRHERDRASPDRIIDLVANGEPVCSVAFLKTPEREEKMLFSRPDMILPPNGLILRRGDPAFGSDDVSLREVLSRPGVRIGIATGRSYGSEIDPILREAPPAALFRRQGDDILRGLLQMLVRERLDAVLGYPYEARWIADQLGISDQIASVGVVEADRFAPAHVVCPRTDWGRRIMTRVDEVLETAITRPEYRAFVERWLPEDRVDDLRRAWEQELLGAGP